MPKLVNFKPTHELSVTSTCTIQILIAKENGEAFVYSSFYDEITKQNTRVSRTMIKFTVRGHPYFIKNRQRFYLNDFTKKTPF